MDSMTAAKRLHRSYGELGRIFGGSFSTTASLEPSRSRGSSSPSCSCSRAVGRGHGQRHRGDKWGHAGTRGSEQRLQRTTES